METYPDLLGTNEELHESPNGENKKRNSQSLVTIKEIPYPILEIKECGSSINQHMEIIKLTQNSITSSQGCFYKQENEKFHFGREPPVGSLIKNDYNFLDENMGVRQFEISFQDNKFFLGDNKKGTGIFMKIKDKVLIDHDMIVSFSTNHMILRVGNEIPTSNEKLITIGFLQGPLQNKEQIFNSKNKQIIRIGRSKNAEVVFTDDSVSRIQCTLSFESGQWFLYDGELENGGNKSSTNGLW